MLPWQQYSRCHFVSFVMHSSGAKFKEHCSNTCKNIINSVFYRLVELSMTSSLSSFAQKHEYLSLKRKEIVQKEKRHSPLL